MKRTSLKAKNYSEKKTALHLILERTECMRFLIIAFVGLLIACSPKEQPQVEAIDSVEVVKPIIVTDAVTYDTDDPAIWIHPSDPGESLVIGTDKGGDLGDGALYVFNLK